MKVSVNPQHSLPVEPDTAGWTRNPMPAEGYPDGLDPHDYVLCVFEDDEAQWLGCDQVDEWNWSEDGLPPIIWYRTVTRDENHTAHQTSAHDVFAALGIEAPPDCDPNLLVWI